MGIAKRQLEHDMDNRSRWAGRSNRYGQQAWPIDVTIEGDAGLTQRHEREQDKKAVAEFNRQVRAWGTKVTEQLKTSIATHIVKDEHLSASLKNNYRHYGKAVKAGKEITSIGFSFVEEGVFVHLGVGRGYNMENGTRILTKKSNHEWKRFPQPWFNPVIERNIPALADIVKNYCGDLFVNATRIYINR